MGLRTPKLQVIACVHSLISSAIFNAERVESRDWPLSSDPYPDCFFHSLPHPGNTLIKNISHPRVYKLVCLGSMKEPAPFTALKAQCGQYGFFNAAKICLR